MPVALSGFSSSMGVAANSDMDRRLITAYITNRALQPSPNVGNAVVAPHAAMTGARNDAIAFTNWPEGESRCKFVSADKIGHKWIKRCLHDGVAYSQKREGDEHHCIAVAEGRDEK